MGLESSSMPSPVRALKQRRGWPDCALQPWCPPNRVLPPAELGCRPTGRPPRSAAWARNDRPSQPLRVAAPAVVRDKDVLAHRSFRGLHTTRAIGRALSAPAPAPCGLPRKECAFGACAQKRRDVAERTLRCSHFAGANAAALATIPVEMRFALSDAFCGGQQ